MEDQEGQPLELSPDKSSATLFTLEKKVNFPLAKVIDNIQVFGTRTQEPEDRRRHL